MKDNLTADKLKAVGIEPVGGTRQAFNEFIKAEKSRLGFIVKSAGMKED